MNPNECSLFVPGIGGLAESGNLTFGRPPHRRLWRGCAARLAGVEADRRSGLRDTPGKFVGHFASALDIGAMKRKQQSAVAFFTERSLASYLAVSDRTIRNWISRGDLPSYKLGAARRIDPADVEDFLSRHRDETS